MSKRLFSPLAIGATLTGFLVGCDASTTWQSDPGSNGLNPSHAGSIEVPPMNEAAPSDRQVEIVNSPAAKVPYSENRQCRLEVDGKIHVDQACEVFPMGDGGYTLNAWTLGKPKNSHFAVVIVGRQGEGDASWNADPDDDKAMDPLGTVLFKDGCWVNERAKICTR